MSLDSLNDMYLDMTDSDIDKLLLNINLESVETDSFISTKKNNNYDKCSHCSSESIVKNLYWQSKAYKIAEKGIFNQKNKTPLDSVYSSNLWKVLEFISIETAEETYKAELQQQAHDDAMKKNRKR